MNHFTLNRIFKLFLLLIVLSCGEAMAQKLREYDNGVLKGTIKVKLRPEVVVSPQGLKSHSVDGIAQIGVLAIDRLNVESKAQKMERVFPYSPKFETRHQKHGLHLWYRIEVDETMDVRELVKAYALTNEIEIAELYHEKQLIPYSITMMDEATEAALKSAQTAPFNDPLLVDQWHYNNTGEGDVLEGADISLYKAWEKQAGQSNIIVSVHDEGIQYDHEDLAANMWINEAELNGVEGVDDDGNGYIDDIYGFNFTNGTGQFVPAHHGTHVAGTVAAVNNNGIGVAGVAGGTGNNDGVKIMGCQIIGGDQYPDIEASYVYAADMGAVISQNSWGWIYDGEYEQSVLDAIDYFIEEAGNYPGSPMKGGIAIFAAGNNGSSGLHYPGAYENTIAVGATGPTNLMTDYSNYGEYVDITAPGGENAFGEQFGILSTVNFDGYAYLDGTSMACPHVSGVAALILSEYGSETFTADDLKIHLLGGTNVLDTLPGNSERIGLMGVGGTDAELALRTNTGIPPNTIDDLSLVGISQDFATLQWTIPVDSDDDKASFFEIYYSTSDFNESTIANAQKVLIHNIYDAGQTFNYELTGLEATTQYYFAVKALDRWGNASTLSNKVQGTTNAGPEVEFSVPEISFDIDINISAEASSSFDLRNVGEGVLKWEVQERHISNNDTYSVAALNYPKANSVPKLPEVKSAPILHDAGSIVPYAQKPVEDDALFYFHPSYLLQSMTTIGDLDTDYTNSLAVRYELTREQGFNMTHFEFAINVPDVEASPLEKPIILEIYEGAQIESAKLVYAQEYIPTENTLWHFVEMTEQVFFESGDSFFLVVHMPAGIRYPLVGSWGYHPSFADFQFYSNNLGQSWGKLADVFHPDYVWDVAAWSMYEPLGTYLKLSPTNGVVNSMSSENITIDLDASQLINGDYKAKLSFLTNETGKEISGLPVNFSVSGNKPVLESENVLEFGNVFVGESTAMSIEIYNNGLGAFAGNSAIDIQISNPDFQLTHSEPRIIYAERSVTLSFRYWPKKAGASNSSVTLSDKDGNQYKFNLYGVGTNPPVATVEPAENSFAGLNLGDVVNGSFTLRNDGEYPLKYYVPKFADGSNMGQENSLGMVHLFGYAGGQVEGDATTNAFEWIDISSTGTEVGSNFASNSKITYIDVPIGFDFPFFEEKEDTVYITKQGALSFTTDGWFNSQPVMYSNKTQPSKLICAYGLEMDLSKGGAIYYQRYPDRFVTQYNNIEAIYLDDQFVAQYTKVTFQIVLFINGDIEIYYKDMGTIPYGKTILGYRTTMNISIYDKNLQDGLLLNGMVSNSSIRIESKGIKAKTDMPPTTGYMMYFRYPGLGSVQSVTNPFGTLQVGESVQLDYVVDTKDLFVDDFVERINVISNDPVTNPAVHNINLNIVSGGEVDYQYDVESIEFGQVFQRDNVTRTFSITNKGKAIGTIESISFQNGHYIAEGYLPVELKPNSRVEYIITINSAEMGTKDDMLVFTDNHGGTFQIPVKGMVVEAPIISTVETELSEILNYGTSETSVLNIENTGRNPMLISPVGNEWLRVVEQGYTGQTKEVDYQTTFVELGGSVYDHWIDIRETGTKLEHGDMFEKADFWRPVKMPFEFSFYGDKQDSLFIGFNGILMFENPGEAYSFGPQQLIPHAEAPNNFIAPLWGPIGPGYAELYPTTGTYYQEYDDKVVVQFQHFENLFSMGYPVSFEVVLYKNGNIKFMYQFEWEEYTTQWCVAGIENQDGSKGHSPSQFVAGLIKDGSVITFVPVEEYEIAAQSSKNFDIIYDARSIYGGTYTEELLLSNNTPDAPDYSLPVTMTVVGEKKIELKDSLKLGEVFIYDEVNETDGMLSAKEYDVNFTLGNIGTEKIYITRMRLQQRAAGLTVMGDQDKFGTAGADDPWIDVSRKVLNYYLHPGNSETFNLRVKPTIPADIIDTVLVYCDLEGGLYKIPVSAEYTNPPVVNIQSEGIEVFANTKDDIITESVVIDNIQGDADLTYEIDFEFERLSNEDTKSELKNQSLSNEEVQKASGIVTSGISKLKSTDAEVFNSDEYNRILEHEVADQPYGNLGFGGGASFYAGTAFWAPEDGFNLTHALTWVNWAAVLEYDVNVYVYGGAETLQDAELLHSELFSFTEMEETKDGELKTFELSSNFLFYPNEKFYIVFRYDRNLEYPQGYIEIEETPEHYYYFGNDEVMFEMLEAGYDTWAWYMKAAEESYSSNIWAVLDSNERDTIHPGSSQTLDLRFIAEYADQGINVANMLVKSNDPVTPVAKLAITLNRNKGPQYSGGNSIYYAINEGDTLRHTVSAYDDEGDDFTIELKKEYEFVTAVSNNNEMEITFAPDYEAAGIHQIIVVGIDSYGNESEFILDVAVVDVNRAPLESPEIGNQYYVLETDEAYTMDLNEYIIDPDGGEVSYEIIWQGADIIDIYKTGASLIMHTTALGSGTMKVVSTDDAGATLVSSFNVFVDHRTAVDSEDYKSLLVYPNPTSGILNIQMDEYENEKVMIRITNSSGVLLKQLEQSFMGGIMTVNIEELSQGLYFLEIQNGEQVKVQKIRKN